MFFSFILLVFSGTVACRCICTTAHTAACSVSFELLLVMQAAISRLNTQAAIIGVQDSLHHVQPQLSFLQSLLGMLVAVVHSFASRSLQYCARQSQGAMQAYLSAPSHYCGTDFLQPGPLFCCFHFDHAWLSCLAVLHVPLHLQKFTGS